MAQKFSEKEKYISGKSGESYRQGLNIIMGFWGRLHEREAVTDEADSLYKAAAFLCHDMKIPIVPYKELTAVAGDEFSVNDIGRMSHFAIRKVLLEKDFEKYDCGSLLAYIGSGNDKIPVVIYNKGIDGLKVYNPEDGSIVPVTQEIINSLYPEAFVFYRPFPNKVIKFKDLMLFGFSRIYPLDIIVFAAVTLLIMLINQLLPMLTRIIYDVYINLTDEVGIIDICLVILIANLSSMCMSIVKNFAFFRSISRAKYSIQEAVFDRIFHMPVSKLREYDAADMGMRAQGITGMFNLFVNSVSGAIFTAFTALAYLFVMSMYSAKLMGYGLLLLLLMIAIIAPLMLVQSKYSKKQLDGQSELNSEVYQFIDGIVKLKLSESENQVVVRFLQKYADSRKNITKSTIYGKAVSIITTAGSGLSSFIFYALIIRGNMNISVGSFLAFVSAYSLFSAALLGLLNSFSSANLLVPLYENAKPILETPPEYQTNMISPTHLSGKIELDHVTFSYVKDGPVILDDISLSISPGEYIGIVGSSGCGKSTLINILLGFELPDMGKVYYDEYDVSKVNMEELRKRMGVVMQNGKVFAGSIAENITLTSENATNDDVVNVLKAVGLYEEIKQMPMGIHTYLSEGGGTVSGGQQQRILIARAIINKPGILIFDEATSALDNVTQDQVCKSLDALNTTRIVVAHRLSTVINCDRILVMDKGRIIDSGTYNELMERCDLFKDIAFRQVC